MILGRLFEKIRARSSRQNNLKRFPKDTYLKIRDFFIEQNLKKKDVIIVCIGTNRIEIIDCLGPLVGTILKGDREFEVPVYGTMGKPIHALNLVQSITEIKNTHPNSSIIAIDASLTAEDSIGQISIGRGPILPGRGANKKIPGVGDYSIKGCVAPFGINVMEYDTDLSFISEMAFTIAQGIKEAFS